MLSGTNNIHTRGDKYRVIIHNRDDKYTVIIDTLEEISINAFDQMNECLAEILFTYIYTK